MNLPKIYHILSYMVVDLHDAYYAPNLWFPRSRWNLRNYSYSGFQIIFTQRTQYFLRVVLGILQMCVFNLFNFL